MDIYEKTDNFLEYAKKQIAAIKNFADKYAENKYELILRAITAPDSLSTAEWDLIASKYTTDTDVALALSEMSNIPDSVKESIAVNFLDGNIKFQSVAYENILVKNILRNYENISPKNLDRFFKHHCHSTMLPFKIYTDSDISVSAIASDKQSPYPPRTTSQLAIRFLNIIKGVEPAPTSFSIRSSPLPCISEQPTLDYIIANIPEESGHTEKISTDLINNPALSEVKKNNLFDLYGCDPLSVIHPTSYIINSLYTSAIDAMDADFDDFTKKYSDYSGHFLESAIVHGCLTEGMQIDFTNRIISNATKWKKRKTDFMLSLLSRYTQSPKVLHIIFEEAKHINDRDYACCNLNMSEIDLRNQAEIYYQKIKRAVDKKDSDIPKKWFDEIEKVIKRIPLTDEQYDFLLTLNDNAFKILINSYTTPVKYIKQIINHLNKELDDNQIKPNDHLLLKASLHLELKKKGCSQEQYFNTFQFSKDRIYSYETWHSINNNEYSFPRNIIDKELIDMLPELFEKAVNNSKWKPNYGDKKEFLKFINNSVVQKMFDIKEINSEVLKDKELPVLNKLLDINVFKYYDKNATTRSGHYFAGLAEAAEKHY